MNPVDTMFVSAILAACIVVGGALYLQKKWRIYNVLIGKKHAHIVHGLLVGLLALQIVGVGLLVSRSSWSYSPVVPLGFIMVLFSIWLFVTAVKEIGVGAVVNAPLFTGRYKHKGALYNKAKHPMYVSYVLLLLGLSVLLGKIGYAAGALAAAICLGIVTVIEDKK